MQVLCAFQRAVAVAVTSGTPEFRSTVSNDGKDRVRRCRSGHREFRAAVRVSCDGRLRDIEETGVQSVYPPGLIGGQSAGPQSPCGSVVWPTSMM